MNTSIHLMTRSVDVEGIIDYCNEIISVCDDPDQIEMYVEIINDANNRLHALETEK